MEKGDWMQTNAVQEDGEGRRECGQMSFRRKEKGDRSADKCCSGERRREKGWLRETDLREEWLEKNGGRGEPGL